MANYKHKIRLNWVSAVHWLLCSLFNVYSIELHTLSLNNVNTYEYSSNVKQTLAGGWCVFAFCVWAAVFAPYSADRGDVQVGRLLTALYAAAQRPLWSAAIAWLIIVCCTGHGGMRPLYFRILVVVAPNRLTLERD